VVTAVPRIPTRTPPIDREPARWVLAGAFALLLASHNAFGQPSAIPWRSLVRENANVFYSAVRVADGWIGVGSNGNIASVRNGAVTYLSSPLRVNWRLVWAANTGELFVVADPSSNVFAAIRSNDGTWQTSKLNGYGEPKALLGESAQSVWLARAGSGVFHWDGTVWQDVAGLSNSDGSPGLSTLGTSTVLFNGKSVWQLTGGRATRMATLDGFSTAAGRRSAPEWGIRNDEVFKFSENRPLHIGQAPAGAGIVLTKNQTLFVSEWEVTRVQGSRLVRLGPKGLDFAYVGVVPTPDGALALTSTGKELKLLEGRAIEVTRSTAAENKSATVAQAEIPTIDECRVRGTVEPAEAESPGHHDKCFPVVHSGIFTRGNQKFAVTRNQCERLQPVAVERFDGTAWKPLIGGDIISTWQGEPECIGGDGQTDSDLWIAGCGYLVQYSSGHIVRHVLSKQNCINGFFQGTKDAYFYGSSAALRRSGERWIEEPTLARIRSMCERNGRVFAVTDDYQKPQLLVRRDRGYFAKLESAGGWLSGLNGDEFGPVSAAAGSTTDGYLLVGERIEHFDGRQWAEMATSSGLGLKAIGYARGWFLGLGEDGFVYHRSLGAPGSQLVRGPHLSAESLFVESSSEATVASVDAITHFDGQRWSAQPVQPSVTKASKLGLGVAGFARWEGRLLAFQSNGSVLELENGRWQAGSGPVAKLPQIPANTENFRDYENTKLQTPFKPCSVLQPRPDVLVLISCESNWVATLRGGTWTTYPLPRTLSAASSCIEGDGCYLFTDGSPLRAEASQF
jgi:hypothetical protein